MLDVKLKLRLEIESMEKRLRDQQHPNHASGSRMCPECFRSLSPNAKKCFKCDNHELGWEVCNSHRRVGMYFDLLRSNELWPAQDVFRTSSVDSLFKRYLAAAERPSTPACPSGNNCPLRAELDRMYLRVEDIWDDIKGLKLEEAQEV